MTPFGSLTLVVHLVIITLAFVWKMITTRPTSALIIALVFVVTLLSTQTAFGLARDQGLGLYDYGAERLFPCREPWSTGERQVIIRVDEVQAFWLRDTALKMADEAAKENVPLVFGVIPKNILEDTKLVTFLERSRCNIEIAQNGWDYTGTVQNDVSAVEFQKLDQGDAYLRIESGKGALKKITGREPKTFIPPYNMYSEGTALALKQADMPIISSQGTWKYDYTVAPYQGREAPLAPQTVLERCEERFSQKQPCVILFAPKNFSTSEGDVSVEKMKYLQGLFSFLDEHDVTFTTFQRAENL